ncbi:MAG: hypothetical protein QOK02_2531, partial [Mycobacterium sp.]|nr:hypothetical protein [Mycobacterium sp.]
TGQGDHRSVVPAAARCAHGQLTSIESIRRSRPAITSTSALPHGHNKIKSGNSNSWSQVRQRATPALRSTSRRAPSATVPWVASSKQNCIESGTTAHSAPTSSLTLCTRRPAACSHTASTTLCVIAISCTQAPVRAGSGHDRTTGAVGQCLRSGHPQGWQGRRDPRSPARRGESASTARPGSVAYSVRTTTPRCCFYRSPRPVPRWQTGPSNRCSLAPNWLGPQHILLRRLGSAPRRCTIVQESGLPPPMTYLRRLRLHRCAPSSPATVAARSAWL